MGDIQSQAKYSGALSKVLPPRRTNVPMDAPRRLVTFTNIPDGNIKLEHFRLCHAALFGEAASGCGAVVLRCQTKEKGVDLRLHERRTDAQKSRLRLAGHKKWVCWQVPAQRCVWRAMLV